MSTYKIGYKTYAEDAPELQEALAAIYESDARPLCMCVPKGVEMYISRFSKFVVKRMPDSGHLHAAECDSFEVAELHVAPDYQGRGVGADLLLRLTSGRPERTALLSTRDADTPARRLYRGTGFTDLLTAFRFFPGGDPPYAVMGAELPLRDRSPKLNR